MLRRSLENWPTASPAEPKLRIQVAGVGPHVDPLVRGVGDVDVVAGVERDAVADAHLGAGAAAPRAPVLAARGAGRGEAVRRAARGRELPDLRRGRGVVPVVGVQDPDVAEGVRREPHVVVVAARHAGQGDLAQEGAVLVVARHDAAGGAVREFGHQDVAVAGVDGQGVRLADRTAAPERAQVVAVQVVSADLEVEVVAHEHLVAHGVVLDAPGVDAGLAASPHGTDQRRRHPGRLGRGGGEHAGGHRGQEHQEPDRERGRSGKDAGHRGELLIAGRWIGRRVWVEEGGAAREPPRPSPGGA